MNFNFNYLENGIKKQKILRIKLFLNVKNKEELFQKIKANEIDSAFLNPVYIVSLFQIQVACHNVMNSLSNNHLKTKNLHTELIYYLYPGKSVKKALEDLGIGSNNVQHILECKFIDSNENSNQNSNEIENSNENSNEIENLNENYLIQGEEQKNIVQSLNQIIDLPKIKKLYKINEKELLIGSLEDAVVLAMSTKEF
ncbi:cgi-121 family member [Anaeramoeba ignava]|uniref:Cgi-121 family member n=1 Tax=Anaeramoeba ignava TaxID=1746090 RepID=A0A9Q0R911_ANAIG|nr:cgi-121 family member [Anaeramoeba ignava]